MSLEIKCEIDEPPAKTLFCLGWGITPPQSHDSRILRAAVSISLLAELWPPYFILQTLAPVFRLSVCQFMSLLPLYFFFSTIPANEDLLIFALQAQLEWQVKNGEWACPPRVVWGELCWRAAGYSIIALKLLVYSSKVVRVSRRYQIYPVALLA